MKKLGFLTAMLLVACSSSSSKDAAKPEQPMVDPTPSETAGQMAADQAAADPTMADPTRPAMPTTGVADTTDAAMPEPAMPMVPTAEAHLVAIKDGAAMGHISFENHDGEITMAGAFSALPPGPHAFYIHEKGDCSNKGKMIGKHLDPTKAKHGPPASSKRHAGDLGDLVADADGNATFQMSTNSVVLDGGRPDSIVQRAIVIHAKKDDKAGSGGAPIACGVIEMVDPNAQASAPTE